MKMPVFAGYLQIKYHSCLIFNILKKMKNAGKVVLSLLLVSSVSAGASYLTTKRVVAKMDAPSVEFEGQNARLVSTQVPSGIETGFTVAAEQSVNAVVHIASKTLKTSTQAPMDMFEYLFGFRGQQRPQQQTPQVGYGSGVIISSDGYIVTNNHVVEGADEINVTLNERKTYSARVIGSDPNTDIALIKIDAKDLPVIKFGNSDDLKVGEWVLAVGNPMNLTSTVTAGIVSAKARNLGIIGNGENSNPFQDQNSSQKSNMSLESFIQTDAAVNPGNSGGALVNLRGELVGINAAIVSPTGSFAGYSFAIPVNIVAKVVGDMKQFGTVQRAMLGVTIKNINSEMAKEKNISVQDGVYVESVADRSGSMEAGIKAGDIITKINDVKVNTMSELSDTEKQNLNITYGVKVSGITDGKFKEIGIRKSFIILKVNDIRIESVEHLEKTIQNIQKNADFDGSGLFIVGMYPNGKVTYYAIDLT